MDIEMNDESSRAAPTEWLTPVQRTGQYAGQHVDRGFFPRCPAADTGPIAIPRAARRILHGPALRNYSISSLQLLRNELDADEFAMASLVDDVHWLRAARSTSPGDGWADLPDA
jgi:hypothetical protein